MHLKSYEDLREFDLMSEVDIDLANHRATKHQRSIGEGDYWMRLVTDVNEVVAIFGHVFTWSEAATVRTPMVAGIEQVVAIGEGLATEWAQGFRFGMAYSSVFPHGEFASTHVSDMLPIEIDHYIHMRNHRWDLQGAIDADDELAIALHDDWAALVVEQYEVPATVPTLWVSGANRRAS